MRALVTGATGFIGSWLCRALEERGLAVSGLALDRTPWDAMPWDALTEFDLDRLPLYACDIRDRGALADVIAEARPEIVFHLAAQALVLRAWDDPAEVWETNVAGTWNLFSALDAQRNDAPVIVASSDKAYGKSSALPYREDHPLLGEHPYDASKAAAERVARSYAARTGRATAIVRCGNVVGGGDMHFSRIVPGTSLAVLSGISPIVRSDGSPTRDYVSVRDAAGAYVWLAERALDGGIPATAEAYNISYGDPWSVLDVVSHVAKTLSPEGGRGLEPTVQGGAQDEIPHQYLDSSLARSLGWQPQDTSAEAIAEAARWYRAHNHALPSADRLAAPDPDRAPAPSGSNAASG